MNEKAISYESIINKYSNISTYNYLADINMYLKRDRRKIVVLDDDPTGTQTVHGVPVLTEWTLEALVKEFENDVTAFYILTNTRAFSEKEAREVNRQIGSRLKEAAIVTGRDFSVISRSDSTLRGHFPAELEALQEVMGQNCDGWLVYPYFLEGKRYTVDDIHYVEEKGELIPSGITPFAADAVFGYKSSNIKEYVEEKTGGRIKKEKVVSVTIDDIRSGGTERVEEILSFLRDGQVCVINSISMQDVRCVALAALRAEIKGKKFLYRTSASFVQARLGQKVEELLSGNHIASKDTGNGGAVFVGSYVPKTTAQLKYLMDNSSIIPLEVSVLNLLDDKKYPIETESISKRADKLISEGRDVVIFTSRDIVKSEDTELNLMMGLRMSKGLMDIAKKIKTQPKYLISKGGITSSDMATKGLNSKRALVLGQILPGIPVWQLGPESRYPGMAFVIFPGNVGDEAALFTVVEKLKSSNSNKG